MENDQIQEMWPEDVENDDRKQLNTEDPTVCDFKHLLELTNHSAMGSSQLADLVKCWEYKQANATRLLREEIDILSKQTQEAERKEMELQHEHHFKEERPGHHEKHPVPNHVLFQNKIVEVDAEYETVVYWKRRAMHSEKLLEESIQREQTLTTKLQENIKNLEVQSAPVEELSQILKRADNFLHLVLQNAPVVIGHQDKDLRYRFIYNHFPSLEADDLIGKTDVELFTGVGVKESQDFKREVLERGLPAKREITFETPLFGSKTFLLYVEPVFRKSGETIGINYMGMEITDQVIKREKMAKLREEIAFQKLTKQLCFKNKFA